MNAFRVGFGAFILGANLVHIRQSPLLAGPTTVHIGSQELTHTPGKVTTRILIVTSVVKSVAYGLLAPTVMIYYAAMYATGRTRTIARSFIPGCGFELVDVANGRESQIGLQCNEW